MNKTTSFCLVLFALIFNVIHGADTVFFSPLSTEDTSPPDFRTNWSIWDSSFSLFPKGLDAHPKPLERASPLPETAEMDTLLRIAGVDDSEAGQLPAVEEEEPPCDIASTEASPPQEPVFALPTATFIPPFPPCYFCPYFHHPTFICPPKHHYFIAKQQQRARDQHAFLEHQAALRQEEALRHEYMMMQQRKEESRPYS